MNSIIIRGSKDAGKSTTIREVCKRLGPQKIYKLIISPSFPSRIDDAKIEDIFNDTFVIEISGKSILICAGAPTEQNKPITLLIKICIELEIEISFALVAMRSFERLDDFDTPKELKDLGEIISTEWIRSIPGDYQNTQEWNERISRVSHLVETNI